MKRKVFLIPLLVLVVVLGAVMTAGAANGAPGSESDPVVTKSYVDSAIDKLIASKITVAIEELKATIAEEITAQVATAKIEIAEAGANGAWANQMPVQQTAPSQTAGADLSFEVLELPEGVSLIGKSGTEIIVRSGRCQAIDNGANGLSDITEGRDVLGGTKLETNHLLLCPRDDGRGIKAVTSAWIMVRGEYTLQ